jgi:hypothetical protein
MAPTVSHLCRGWLSAGALDMTIGDVRDWDLHCDDEDGGNGRCLFITAGTAVATYLPSHGPGARRPSTLRRIKHFSPTTQQQITKRAQTMHTGTIKTGTTI